MAYKWIYEQNALLSHRDIRILTHKRYGQYLSSQWLQHEEDIIFSIQLKLNEMHYLISFKTHKDL